MSGNAISKYGGSAALLALLTVCGMADDGLGFPRFDQIGLEIKRLNTQWESFEARIQSGELPAKEVQVHVDRLKGRLAAWEPHRHPELRRYWAEQGREHARLDLAKGTIRLFYVNPAPSYHFEGMFPVRKPPVDEFEALLLGRIWGASIVRVNERRFYSPDWIAVNTRCDGYNEVVERHCREKHGFDIVSQLWRIAEKEAWGTKQPVPTAQKVWLPFAACGASLCLFVGLVLIRRRRERRGISGFRMVIGAASRGDA